MDMPIARRASALLVGFCLLGPHAAEAAVGRTPGTASVTPGGEAAYSIPIRLPPGANGMTPALSLEYRHRTRSGLLGVGWSIAGLSQIARCPRTIAQDGVNAPVTQTAVDRFCLDGQRLVVVNGVVYGAVGAEYRTEIESYSRIRSVAGSSPGPRSFVVETSDGRILEYGATADSRIDSSAAADPPHNARIWALNRIRDRNGNTIDLEYVEDLTGGTFRIANLRYTSNAGAGVAGSHRVAFAYEARPSNEVDITYVAGTPIRQVVRLTRIDVLYGDLIVRGYELAYEPALSTAGRSRLASVRECAANGICIAPTVFSWQDGQPGFGAAMSVAATTSGSQSFPRGAYWQSVDINGDGRSDQVWAHGAWMGSSVVHYRLAAADGSFGPVVVPGIPSPYGLGTPFDHDGDGRIDLLMLDSSARWVIVPGTASGLGTPFSAGIPLPQGGRGMKGADLNGDGLGDIAWSEAPDDNANSLKVYVRYALPGGGFSATPALLYDQDEYTAYEYSEGGEFFGRGSERIDFDGDGADDLLMNENYSVALISGTTHAPGYFDSSFVGATTFDFNGDGCSDFAYKHYTGRLRIRGTACGVYWDGTELQGPAWTGAAQLFAHDWNGDGREDLLVYGQTNWMVALSTGSSLLEFADTGIAHGGALDVLAADVNGDGLQDLVTRTANGFQLRLRNGPVADLLVSATDGFGVSAAFHYRPLTDSAVYVRGPDAAHPDRVLQSAAQVVHELERSDGSGTGSRLKTRYAYEGLRHNQLGRGSLGFRRRVVHELNSPQPLVREETRRQDYPFIGLPESLVDRLPSGPTVSETRYEWRSLDPGGGLRHYPYAHTTTDRRFEAIGSLAGSEVAKLVRTVAAIDPLSGKVTDETATITEGPGGNQPGAAASLRILHAGLLNDPSSWCLGRPLETRVTSGHSLAGGEAVTRSQAMVWDAPSCRPTQVRRDPESAGTQVTIALAYDGFGNVSGRAVSASGASSRTTTVQWDPQGRLPTSVTNPLGQVHAFTWDHATGLPLGLTDPNALTTAWTYDLFGRLASERHPDNTITMWTRAACPYKCDPRFRYQLTERQFDATGAAQTTTVVDLDQHDRGYRLASQEPGGGLSVRLADLDALGRISRSHLPFWIGEVSPGYWQLDYDAVGRASGISLRTAAGASERSHELRHDGLSVTHVDPLGRTTTGRRTAWGAPAEVVDPAGGTTRYEYDAFGNLRAVYDAEDDRVAEIRYDVRGLPVWQQDADSGIWTYGYNALGELISIRDARGQSIALTYDPLGRLKRRTAPDGNSVWTWGSSASKRNIGGLSRLTGPGYAENFTHDTFGRLASWTITTDAAYRYNFAYDAFGQPATLTYPATGIGGRFKLGYAHEAGQLVRIFNPNQPATVFWRRNAADAAGRIIDESLGSATRVVSGFDPLTGAMDYRQVIANGTAVRDRAFAWDGNDNFLERRHLASGPTETSRYDALDRLEDARRDGAITLDLDYAPTGNVLRRSDVCPGGAPCYAYTAARKHAVTAAGGVGYAYDANGNMVARGQGSISWNSDNLPLSISDGAGNSSQFSYGPMGNRWRQVASYSGVAETTTYAGPLAERVQRNGATSWRHYIVSPTGIAALHRRHGDGTPASTHYLTQDHLGSTDVVLNGAGKVVLSAAFAPFGARLSGNGTGAPTASELATIASLTRVGFTGHEHLDNLGLIHMNGRVYDPRIGRFLSADPFVTAPFNGQSLNRYSYVLNNPLSLVDPSGFNERVPCAQSSPGVCAHITVVGVSWVDYLRIATGGGSTQVSSALQRDSCGQEGFALTCSVQAWQFVEPSSIVLTAGTQADPTLNRNPTVDYLQGAAARVGNLVFSASPVTWLFGASPDFEWFDVPDSVAGQAGATLGNVGYFAGGFAGIVRKGGAEVAQSASRFARSLQGTRRYPGVDRYRDITLRKGTIIYSAFPGQSAFYTTASALRRSGNSAEVLFKGLQAKKHKDKGYWSRVAAYEVIDDIPAAFGRARTNLEYGPGGFPQVVVPSYKTSIRYLGDFPIGP